VRLEAICRLRNFSLEWQAIPLEFRNAINRVDRQAEAIGLVAAQV
jgi:hypothetical protein